MFNWYKLIIAYLCISTSGFSQTLGGNAVFNFIAQPNSAQLAALGGVNVSSISNDVGMIFHAPSLLRKEMDQQVNTSANSFIAGISQYSLTCAKYFSNAKLNIGAGIQYFNYGNINQTDIYGNSLGTLKPNDYVIQIIASKNYKDHFRIGTTVKFIHSNYGQYRSAAVAADLGLTYYNDATQLQSTLVIKNMGSQLNSYSNDGIKEELPFDIQFGISKKLINAPLQFSLTAHHLQQLNIYYNDTLYNLSEGIITSKGLAQKIFTHLVLATQCYLTDRLELTAGINLMRRQELNNYGVSNGLNGFTFGAGVFLKKLHVRYATGFYQRNLFHQFSLNFNISGNPLQ
jgi:hypothetical protein